MFFIYSGYVSVDSDFESPNYTISKHQTAEQVVEFRKEFDEEIDDDCANVEFRVFEGKERHLVPKKVVESFQLV